MGSDDTMAVPGPEKGLRSHGILRRLAGPLIAVATLLLILGGLDLADDDGSSFQLLLVGLLMIFALASGRRILIRA